MKPTLSLLFFLFLYNLHAQDIIEVTSQIIKISPKSKYELFFGFEKGDEIIFEVKLIQGKNIESFEIIEYPTAIRILEKKIESFKEGKVFASKRNVYQFLFKNNTNQELIVNFHLKRHLKENKNSNFDTDIVWITKVDTIYKTKTKQKKGKYKVVELLPITEYYVNSGSNATFLGGKSRLTQVIKIPQNSIQCYFLFSCLSSKKDISITRERIKNSALEFNKIVNKSDNIQDIKIPVFYDGTAICDIYLMDEENSKLFLEKNRFSNLLRQENISCGFIRFNVNPVQDNLFIGIKNPDSMDGINVVITALAVVFENKSKSKYKLVYRRIPTVKDFGG